MAGEFRCSVGHAWTVHDGDAPAACPVCGDTILNRTDPTAVEKPEPAAAFVMAVAPGHPVPGDKDKTLPAGPHAPPTLSFPPTPHPDHPESLPSFSSLVGMPQPPRDPFAIDPDDVVPFGPETIDFTPPPVPGYEIVREVGRGGMGVVYLARQVSLGRPVALKMILAGHHAGPAERDRFRREAAAVATLQHPHIVQIFEIGEANGQLYLALEFVEGGSLAQHLTGTPWPARDAAGLIEVLARAVQYAHTQGVVHRDLKPGNVLLSGVRGQESGVGGQESGVSKDTKAPTSPNPDSRLPTPGSRPPTPKITDFGLAKRMSDSDNPDGTKTGAVMGTPSYIAPEQASGKTREVGPAADVYALGAILYELLTGRPPFLGETPLDTVLQVLHDDPVPPKRLQPTVPHDLETICLKCLNKSQAERYATADALADDLRRFHNGEPIQARPLSAWGRGVKWAKRHPSMTVLGVVTLVAMLALIAVLSVAYARVRDAVTEKQAEAAAARDARMKEAEERKRAEALATENEKRRREADERSEALKREAERTRRVTYALQLAQVAAMCERDPRRARDLLEDDTRCPPDLRDFAWAYLHRLCQRDERVYAEHPANDPLHAVAYSPAGSLVATAGRAGPVRIWDPRTGRTWAILLGNTRQVSGVAFSPDGGAVATAGADGSIRLWELPVTVLNDVRRVAPLLGSVQTLIRPLSLQPAVTLAEAHAGDVNCVAFSPDGRFLVSGGEDGDLKWWDLGGWRVGNPDAGVAGGAAAAGAVLAAARQNAQPVWERWLVKAHPGGVRSVAFAASGRVLVTGGADRSAVVWARTETGLSVLHRLGNHADAVLAVAVTPDGKVAATVNNGSIPTIRLIDVGSGRDIRRLIGHTAAVHALAIGGEGELLASAGFDKTVRLWEVNDGKERGLLLGHELAVSAVAPDRRTVVSAGMDATARVWQTTARTSEDAETLRDGSLTAAALSVAGAAVLGGDERGRFQVYRSDVLPLRPGLPRATAPFALVPVLGNVALRGQVRAAAASADGQTVFASTDDGVFVWRILRPPGVRQGGPPLPLSRPLHLRLPRPVYAMALDPSGQLLATLDQEGVRLWDVRSLPLTAHADTRPVTPEGPGLVRALTSAHDLAFSPAGDRLAVAFGTGVCVLDRDGKVLTEMRSAHPATVEAVTFGGHHGGMLATADTNGLVKVWRLADGGEPTLQAELAGHTGAVYALAFSPDGQTLASGGYDRTVLLWDPISGQERAALTGHADRVLRVQFLPDASALITVGRDGTVKRWRAAGGALPAAPPRTEFGPFRMSLPTRGNR